MCINLNKLLDNDRSFFWNLVPLVDDSDTYTTSSSRLEQGQEEDSGFNTCSLPLSLTHWLEDPFLFGVISASPLSLQQPQVVRKHKG